MALYIVRARPKKTYQILGKNGILVKYQDFGPSEKTLQYGLDNGKNDKVGYALGIEEDYCSPPLAIERESVLDRYFDDITVQLIALEKEGFDRIAQFSGLRIKNKGNIGIVDNQLNHKLLLNKTLDLQSVGVIWARKCVNGFGHDFVVQIIFLIVIDKYLYDRLKKCNIIREKIIKI